MPRVEENKAAEKKEGPGLAARVGGFLLPDRLRPPKWSEFRGRWIALFALSAAWLAALKTAALWPQDELARHLVYAAAAVLLLAPGIGLYGPRRLAGELGRADWKSVGYHVAVVTVLLVLGGKAFEWLGACERGSQWPAPEEMSNALMGARLLAVGGNTTDAFDNDRKRAGIPKHLPGQGKLDFHGLRVAYVSFVVEAGTSAKEAQSLVRHCTPDLTMNTYARARRERLVEVAEKVGQAVKSGPDNAPCMHKKAAGAESLKLSDGCVVGEAGFEPARGRTPSGF